MRQIIEEPVELRTVGPAPPESFKLHGHEIVLQTAKNPYRVNQQRVYDPHYMPRYVVEESTGRTIELGVQMDYWNLTNDLYLSAAQEGGRIYFQECVFCHGANLNGRGIFTQAFSKPFPTNFTDPGTIAQLQESYAFWRTASGGINLPLEGFPWASTMPRMEEHLSTDDIWKVVLFTYWHTGWVPRTWD
ncbi:MAG: c-type cytochrome [Nitrospirales bacterium]